MSVFKLFAQPSGAATTPPARNSADVISLFSDAYTDLAGTDWFPNWGQSTVVTDVTISGNATKRYATLNYQGIEISGSINVSTMQYLHVDIWTANCTAFEVFLINEGAGEQGYTITPTASGWKSVDIPLTQYNSVSLSNVGQIKLVGTPFGTSDVYLDNLYFWKSANTPSLSNFSIPNKVFGDAPFTITAPTSNSTGTFTYSSSNTAVATVSGSTITLTGVGTTTITATQAASGSYGTGSISATLVVSSPPPATAAPTPPARNSANVISMFSN
ncbi:MAG: Ig-like domain-containing protein, partial [Dolichospermum sp.]